MMNYKEIMDFFPLISINPKIMGGVPCIKGDRIPVHMVLSAIISYGTLEGALKFYPKLTMQQVKEAVGFARLVMEYPCE
jgi:uncharacterized protein (DUF433 family)